MTDKVTWPPRGDADAAAIATAIKTGGRAAGSALFRRIIKDRKLTTVEAVMLSDRALNFAAYLNNETVKGETA